MKIADLFQVVLTWEDFKDWLSGACHVSHWTIHAAIGIPAILIFGRLMRKPLASLVPLVVKIRRKSPQRMAELCPSAGVLMGTICLILSTRSYRVARTDQ
jgi:hypothetical protein